MKELQISTYQKVYPTLNVIYKVKPPPDTDEDFAQCRFPLNSGTRGNTEAYFQLHQSCEGTGPPGQGRDFTISCFGQDILSIPSFSGAIVGHFHSIKKSQENRHEPEVEK
ncbi:hypothetical protein HYALB_00010001 [Hymenoscyphus albidus]|uniref:Uncharacterized protein n=1 Tax=Hymenoscyphus albidus TaxID=595503 RepID=A0A9N9LYT7_9HELO|nr:hypothetical protein HYALB_00010001 [Hymenoscyphus albidus]